MFCTRIYQQRREKLIQHIPDRGILLFLGNTHLARNYHGNPFPFRQDSTFLYFFGVNKADCAAVIDLFNAEAVLFGDDVDGSDEIWTGKQPSVESLASACGVSRCEPLQNLTDYCLKAQDKAKTIHFLPPYTAHQSLTLEKVTGLPSENIVHSSSQQFIDGIISCRIHKSAEEIEQIEQAIDLTATMHKKIVSLIEPQVPESALSAALAEIVYAHNTSFSFAPIITVHGEILHDVDYDNTLQKGELLVVDIGVESPLHYASDITRTYPVAAAMTSQQKLIYQTVLKAQQTALHHMKPGTLFRDVHLKASHSIAEGLVEAGVLRGSIDDIVESGSHALFFPHGLGHQLGLDAHDMENFGENNVGYDTTVQRSRTFGLSNLRFARRLEQSMVLTVEPGIYFIPALIDQWHREQRLTQFINYSAIEHFRTFGGIRIEDDALITENGCRVLGTPIPSAAV
ncbi:MAG: aminopeptidase P N-terminal domain-containing protein [Chitinivibrionales bacterium]|nr:aminopeptidase P N-terminal domain-containing protein [Chitinivibrionales bacterium]